MGSVTYQTKVPFDLVEFCEAVGSLFSHVERHLYRDLQRGVGVNQLKRDYQKIYGINARQFNSVHAFLKGKISSRTECHQRQIDQLKVQLSEIDKTIKKLTKRLKKTPPSCSLNPNKRTPRQELRWQVHQKKRRRQTLADRLTRLKRIKPTVIFGSKKLWKAQYNLEANGYASHEEWLTDWQSRRNSQFTFVGSKDETAGCQVCQLSPNGDIKIRVPAALEHRFGAYLRASGLNFPYGQQDIDYAHALGQALTYRFTRKEDQWYCFITTDRPSVPYQSRWKNGMIGCDINPGVIGWAYCDAEGNLKAKGQIRIQVQDRSRERTKATLGDAVKQLVDLASDYACPITVEKLDFSKKKAGMREQGVRYSRMLNNFVYSQFDQMLVSRTQRYGIEIIHVNPAYSSLIGLVKFMSMYGLSSDTAAALVLARRALRKSERLPANYTRSLSVKKERHVWSFWSALREKLGVIQRHSFFRNRVANSGVVVTLSDDPDLKSQRRSGGKRKRTSTSGRDSQTRIAGSAARAACLEKA